MGVGDNKRVHWCDTSKNTVFKTPFPFMSVIDRHINCILIETSEMLHPRSRAKT